jgi:hypothetical protein
MRAIILLASLAVCAPALASGAEGEAKNKERRVCKSVPQTESRLGSSRKCMTSSEWKALSDNTQEDIDLVKTLSRGYMRDAPSAGLQRPQ